MRACTKPLMLIGAGVPGALHSLRHCWTSGSGGRLRRVGSGRSRIAVQGWEPHAGTHTEASW